MVKKEAKRKLHKSNEGLGISGFTLGTLSIVFAIWLGLIGSIIAIIGFVFCKKQQKINPINLGKTGITLNLIGFIIGIIISILAYYYVPI